MGARDLSRPLTALVLSGAAALLLAGAVAGQTAPRNHPLQRRHLMAVRAERTERFLEAWRRADEDRRELARSYLAEAAHDAPLGRRPGLLELTLAAALLEGASPEDLLADPLARFVLSLDLQAIPGAFAPGTPGARGEPVTVGCYALDRRAAAELGPQQVELTLTWLGPAGEQLHGRTEPVALAPFLGKGVVLYLRAPLSAPGRWWLRPEVSAGGRRVLGCAVPVDCRPGGARDPDLHDQGLRQAGPPPGAVALELPAGLALRLHAVGLGPGAPGPRWHLVFLAPAGEAAAGLFQPPLAAAWEGFAADQGATLWSIELEPGQRDLFAEVLKRARAASPGARLIVVGRGDAAFTLHGIWGEGTPAVDGLVLVAPVERLGPLLPRVPTLVIGARGEAGPGEAGPEHVRRVAGSGLALADELSLPADLRAWLAEEFPPSAGGAEGR